MKKKNIAIIGAGISGLMLGCVLRKNSIDCTVYEKSNKITEYGAGISISSNGTMLLENIGVLEQLIKNSCSPISVCIREPNGHLIKKIYNEDFGKILTTNRKELIKVLADKYLFYLQNVRAQKIAKNLDENEVIYLTETTTEKTPEGKVLDKLGLKKLCCRRHMLTHVDIL